MTASQYALFKDGEFVEYRRYEVAPEVAAHKGFTLLPIVEETVDTSTGANTTREVEEIVEASRVVRRVTIADKPQATIDAEIEARKLQAINVVDFDGVRIDKALAMAIFDLANQVRTLQAKQPLTKEQFKDYLKGKL